MNLPPGASPLAAPLCLNCVSNGIPDQHAAGRFRGIGLSPILRWVPLCRPCLQIFHGFTQLIEQGEPLTDAECAQFLGVPPPDFQVSGDDDDGKEAQGAAPETARILPPASVEPPESPGLFPESNTAAKALEAGKDPRGDPAQVDTSQIPPEEAEGELLRCTLCGPQAKWIKKTSIGEHTRAKHPDIVNHNLIVWEPIGPFSCPDAERTGCKATYFKEESLGAHLRAKHPWFKPAGVSADQETVSDTSHLTAPGVAGT